MDVSCEATVNHVTLLVTATTAQDGAALWAIRETLKEAGVQFIYLPDGGNFSLGFPLRRERPPVRKPRQKAIPALTCSECLHRDDASCVAARNTGTTWCPNFRVS